MQLQYRDAYDGVVSDLDDVVQETALWLKWCSIPELGNRDKREPSAKSSERDLMRVAGTF